MNNSGLYRPGGSLILGKYGPDGGKVWTRTIGNTSTSFIDGMSVASDGIYLTGANLTGGLIQKYDTSGNEVWTKPFGPRGGDGISVISSGVYAAGTSSPLTSQSFRGLVMFVRECDLAGNIVWTSEFTNASGSVTGVFANASGVYVIGWVAGNLPDSSGVGAYDAFLVRYELNGSLTWTRQFGTPRFEARAYGVSGDSTGVYVSGFTMSSSFGFLRKYDFSGNLVWSNQIDSPDGSGIGDSKVSVDSSGVYVSLSTNREFIMKYDPNGGRLWSFQMPYSVYGLASGGGRLYVAGGVRDDSGSAGLVAEVSSSPSLVFFGINPPLSFVVVGALVAASATSLFFFRRLRKGRPRSSRARPLDRSLPVRD